MYSVQQARPVRSKPKPSCSRLAIFITLVVFLYATFLYYWFVYRPAPNQQSVPPQDLAGNSQLALQSKISELQPLPSLPSSEQSESKTSSPPPLSTLDASMKENSASGDASEQVPVPELQLPPKAAPPSPVSLRSQDYGADETSVVYLKSEEVVAAPAVAIERREPAAEEVSQQLLASGLHIFYYG
eukprot:1298895-Rhodomonas_salina.2